MADATRKPLLTVLNGERCDPVPIWMMRQAGRHLPEYMELRSRAKDFLDFCYTPSLATEATLQPIQRYDMDGAILFADILLVLDALGQGVRFEKGVGPIVEPIEPGQRLNKVPVQKAVERMSPVFETVSRVKGKLDESKTLIGFAGAPWTVGLYAIEGRGGTDKKTARLWAHQDPAGLDLVLDDLVEVTAHYMAGQVEAGAEALMMFESWAEGLPDDVFEQIVMGPNRKLVMRLRELGVDVPIIGFPRGAGSLLPVYAEVTGVNAVGLDTAAHPPFINRELPQDFPVQGHLDPLLLLAGGERMERRVLDLIEAYQDRPHIFNLGHGVLPETPIKHVERVVELVRTRAS
ncbi:uroporphyrinogen decarboxylase [Henriciella aquimarina]|uniref:uroporphyrinogen decarboxylase n=1 Tax=Henriciella aquimarina TaxID=545261 RepID=UPI000A079CC8|nr:uroporphyrinogen decarboxylase [Henriciella aquimarina]